MVQREHSDDSAPPLSVRRRDEQISLDEFPSSNGIIGSQSWRQRRGITEVWEACSPLISKLAWRGAADFKEKLSYKDIGDPEGIAIDWLHWPSNPDIKIETKNKNKMKATGALKRLRSKLGTGTKAFLRHAPKEGNLGREARRKGLRVESSSRNSEGIDCSDDGLEQTAASCTTASTSDADCISIVDGDIPVDEVQEPLQAYSSRSNSQTQPQKFTFDDNLRLFAPPSTDSTTETTDSTASLSTFEGTGAGENIKTIDGDMRTPVLNGDGGGPSCDALSRDSAVTLSSPLIPEIGKEIQWASSGLRCTETVDGNGDGDGDGTTHGHGGYRSEGQRPSRLRRRGREHRRTSSDGYLHVFHDRLSTLYEEAGGNGCQPAAAQMVHDLGDEYDGNWTSSGTGLDDSGADADDERGEGDDVERGNGTPNRLSSPLSVDPSPMSSFTLDEGKIRARWDYALELMDRVGSGGCTINFYDNLEGINFYDNLDEVRSAWTCLEVVWIKKMSVDCIRLLSDCLNLLLCFNLYFSLFF